MKAPAGLCEYAPALLSFEISKQEAVIMRARFHLPDFSGNFKLNLLLIELLKQHPEYFREGVEIASVYGVFPPCLWNGGRSHCANGLLRAIRTCISSA